MNNGSLSVLADLKARGIFIDIDGSGENLKLKGKVQDLSDTDKQVLIENKREILQFLGDRKKAEAARETFAIPKSPSRECYPLSFTQKAIWALSQFEEGNIAYNIPGSYVFEGDLNVEAFEHAFNTVVDTHESLRTVYKENARGEVSQFILGSGAVKLQMANVDPSVSEPLLQEEIQTEYSRPFLLDREPPLRATLMRYAEKKWLFYYVLHHIAADGLSIQLFIQQLQNTYNALVQGTPCNAKEPLIHYRDFAMWQQRSISDGTHERSRQFWMQKLYGDIERLELPFDFTRPTNRTYNGAIENIPIPSELLLKLESYNRSRNCSLFMSLMSLVNILMHRYTGQKDILIGVPFAGRNISGLENQIGLFVNTIVFRTNVSGESSGEAIVESVKDQTLTVYQHQHYPFYHLLDDLSIVTEQGRNPLFDVMLSLQNEYPGEIDQHFLNVRAVQVDLVQARKSKFDLAFNFLHSQDRLFLRIQYNTDVFASSTAQRMGNHFTKVLEQFLQDPNQKVGKLEYLSGQERRALQSLSTSAPVATNSDSVVKLFEAHAAHHSSATALVFEGKHFTYGEVNRLANCVAHFLISEGIRKEDFVVFQMPKSHWSVITILGILKSGAAFVAVDVNAPSERVRQILSEVQPKLILHEVDILTISNSADNDRNPIHSAGLSNVAYAIFTSGSTGRPKGVLVEHLSLATYISAISKRYGIQKDDRVLQLANFTFDASLEQLFVALCNGASLYIMREYPTAEMIENVIASNGITHLHAVPTLLAQLSWRDDFKLRRIISAGEVCPVTLRTRFPRNIAFYNKYGPTEATISACLFRDSDDSDTLRPLSTLPIGVPLDGYTVVLLDESRNLVPVGIKGEIFIGGPGVARGYLNDTNLTDQCFVRLDSFPGMRFYKTGDFAKWLPDGNILYLRRDDDQFKIRGNRVEAAEIEHALGQISGIREAVVALRRMNDQDELTAYVVSDEAISPMALRKELEQNLPAYMLPDKYVQLTKLPTLSNGKIDRKKLVAIQVSEGQSEIDYEKPANLTEQQVCEIWSKVLNRQHIGRNENFFLLGGNSLKAMRLSAMVWQAFNVKVELKQIFECPILKDQADLIRTLKTSAFEPIVPVEKKPGYVLSSSQKRLWILNQFENGQTSYNIFGVYSIEGAVNFNRLEDAFRQLVDRHESLRTVFRTDEDMDVVQVVLDASILSSILERYNVDISNDGDGRIRSLIADFQQHIFALDKGPLLRAALITYAENKHYFVYTIHHIISDAWSMQVMIYELMTLYHSLNASLRVSPLPELPIQYKDYAEWQQCSLNTGLLNESRVFWMQLLDGELPVLELPLDHPRKSVRSPKGATMRMAIDSRVTQSLKTLTNTHGATLFMTLLSAVKVLLYKYTGQNDIIIGTPVAGRTHPELEGQLGLFVNTLPLRNTIQPERTFRELLSSIRTSTLRAFEHQAYPFDQIVEDLKINRTSSRNVFFDVMVAYQNAEAYEPLTFQSNLAGLSIKDANLVENSVSKFDLSFEFGNEGQELILQVEYNSDLFESETIRRVVGHLLQVLQSISENPALKIAEIEILTTVERTTLVEMFNNTDHYFDLTETFVDYFNKQVRMTPERVALMCGEASITYHELDIITNRFANYLRSKYTLLPDDIVGVKLVRSEWAVISILAILKAGAAYMPIDHSHPQERINSILNRSKAVTVIDDVELDSFRQIIDRYPSQCSYRPGSSHLAYVIFTSGSTGTPKGAMIEHIGMLNHLIEMKATLSMNEETRICQNALYTFDISVWQMLNALICGGTTVMYDYSLILDPQKFLEHIITDRITILQVVPSYLQEILECTANHGHYDLSNIEYLLVTGEAVSSTLIKQWFDFYPGLKVVNAYGPAEASDDVTLHVMDRFHGRINVPVGRPIRNMKIWIVNVNNQLQPVGQYGEICVTGIGVGRGYLNDPERTVNNFVSDPFGSEGGRMYRTGDIGRWLADGTIEFIGRKDHQVKLRGFRIELGDIENALLLHPAIKEAVVVLKETASGEKALAAYFVAPAHSGLENELPDYLRKLIPSYMVPSYLCRLEQLPRNSNGKIDRKALPPLSTSSHGMLRAAHTTTEKEIQSIWQHILGKEVPSVIDNFFELGGHSLKVIKVISMIHEKLNIRISLEFFFSNPDIHSLAKYVDAAATIKNNSVESEDTLLF